MMAYEFPSNNFWTKGSSGIKRASSVENAYAILAWSRNFYEAKRNSSLECILTGEFSDEKACANCNWCQKGALVLLNSQHKDSEHQLSSAEGFDEETLNY